MLHTNTPRRGRLNTAAVIGLLVLLTSAATVIGAALATWHALT